MPRSTGSTDDRVVRTGRRAARAGLLVSGPLLGGLSLLHGPRGRADVEQAERRAAAEVTLGLPAARAIATAQRQAQRDGLSAIGPPTYSRTEVTCRVSSTEAGLMVHDWVQRCDRTVTDGASPAWVVAQTAEPSATAPSAVRPGRC